MNIAIGLDGVVANTYEELLINYVPSEQGLHADILNAVESNINDPLFFLNCIANENAYYAINRWFYDGNDIHILSSRCEELREATEQWLDQWGIPYNTLTMNVPHLTKGFMGKLLDCTALIDHDPAEAEDAIRQGLIAFLVARPYNKIKNNRQVHKINNLFDAVRVLKQKKDFLGNVAVGM